MRNVSLDLINKINNYILVQKFSANATLAILNKEISSYDKQIQEHIKKYTLYLVWLDDNKKEFAQSWEKYVARVEILEAKNNVKIVNKQKTKKLIQDLQDPFSLINKNKQKQKRLNSLSENMWKQEEERLKPKQLAFEEVVSNDGELLITNMKVETIDNELTNETLEELTDDDTIETYNVVEENSTELIEAVNKTISDNFDKTTDLHFDDEVIHLTTTFEELKTGEALNKKEKAIDEILSATLEAEKDKILNNEFESEQTDPVSQEVENGEDELIFESYDELEEDEKTVGFFENADDYSTVDILDEIELVEEELVVLDDSLNGEHDDTFLNTGEINNTNTDSDSIQTADYNELNGEALSFEEPNKEIRFNSEEDKVHFLHEKHYIKEGIGNKFDVEQTEKAKTINEIEFANEELIRTEDYEEFDELTTNSLLETEDITLDSFRETEFEVSDNLKATELDFSTYEEVEEHIATIPSKTVANHLNDTILYGDIDKEFDQEIKKELTQIQETISNLESYTQKEKQQLDDLIFNEEERTLFQFELEDLDVDDTMFEKITLASGVDQITSTVDALKFLDDVEDKYSDLFKDINDEEI